MDAAGLPETVAHHPLGPPGRKVLPRLAAVRTTSPE